MWDPLGPGIKPVAPVLAGVFLSTAPPGKSKINIFIWLCLVLVATPGIFNLHCGMLDLVPWKGIKLRLPALRIWIPSHWTTRKAPAWQLSMSSFSRFYQRLSPTNAHMALGMRRTNRGRGNVTLTFFFPFSFHFLLGEILFPLDDLSSLWWSF